MLRADNLHVFHELLGTHGFFLAFLGGVITYDPHLGECHPKMKRLETQSNDDGNPHRYFFRLQMVSSSISIGGKFTKLNNCWLTLLLFFWNVQRFIIRGQSLVEWGWFKQTLLQYRVTIKYQYLLVEPQRCLFLKVNPSKHGLSQAKSDKIRVIKGFWV